MEQKELNAIGWQCPKPIIESKKILDTFTEGILTVRVDNAVAFNNLRSYAEDKGLGFSSETEDGVYVVHLQKHAGSDGGEDSKRPVVVVSAKTFGKGSDELGENLMKSYLYALTEANPKPQSLIFVNGGVFLACQDSPVLDTLATLEAQGVEIFACGACLNFYDLSERLAIGKVGNMFMFVEKMNNAANCIFI